MTSLEDFEAQWDDIPLPEDPFDPALDSMEPTENAIRHKMTTLRINREANRRLDNEARPPVNYPPVRDLDDLLAEPDSPTPYRIDRVAPADARVMLAAQYKSGKSTLVGNLIRALADCEPFLGKFPVHVPARRIVLIDNELSDNTVRQWLRALRIENTGAVADVVTLRGNVGAFNLIDDHCRDEWVRRLCDLGCDYLILDCLRPVLDALGLDENHDAGRFLVPFDQLLQDAGVSDAALVQHMGHGPERARGDSRLQDWPDAIWRLVRETDEPNSPRYFSAYGRDVNVPESRLAFDPVTRHLSLAGGSRADAKTEAALQWVIQLLAEVGDALSANAIEQARPTGLHTQKSVRLALAAAVERQLVVKESGERNAQIHRIASPCSGCGLPVTTGGDRHQQCPENVDGLFA